MTVLTTSVSATFGNLRYDQHVTSLLADLGLLPTINTVRCTLPRDAPIEAATGDPASVVVDGGDGATTVLTGAIASIRRNIDHTVVTAVDAGGLLARLRPAATYDAQSVTDIARVLAGDAGANTGRLDSSAPLAFYVAHQDLTAAEHVARLATLGGLIATVNADGELEMSGRPAGPPDVALLYGREFATYGVDDAAPMLGRPVMVGHGPAGAIPAPNALLETTDPLVGGASDPGPDAVWLATPALRTPAAVTTAGQEVAAAQTASHARLRADCWLLPALRPGLIVEVQGLPDGLSPGPWMLTAVAHEVDPATGSATRIEAVAGGDALGSLLDAALGALGSLL